MKSKISSYIDKKKSDKLYSILFHKYYDCLSDGFSEEESYNQAMSVIK